MHIYTIKSTEGSIAVVKSDKVLITDIPSALDLIVSVQYETGVQHMALNKEAFSEECFDLKTGILGEILQKFVTYHMRLTIYGDFSAYTSQALKAFIIESNRGKHIHFAEKEPGARS